MSKRILVTGSNGQLGQELQVLASTYPDMLFDFVTREEFDLEDEEQLLTYLNKTTPDYVINCAAYTAVDKAESEPEKATQINAHAVRLLANWSAEHHAKLVHISTDYVFDGSSSIPYTETAVTNPQSVYGSTKLEGEQAALASNPEVLIIRTAWVYSVFGNNFVKTMLRLMQERDSLNIVKDQIGSPTYAADLAQAILKILASAHWESGIYHYSNAGRISWYEFAQAIKEVAGLACDLDGIPTSAYPTPAKRPAYSLLNTQKIQQVYKVAVPDYKESLTMCLQHLGVAKN
ncbi:dTDP-4-dehydrorhamnose reductase [Leeuwenhoekiella blandensis]|uniref:dTDP-4-dehydrorhamnose reductase n=1 Tax=Leeuwenhoekiella blandensis (strain CECT 7118 / CCUG 51940 / KCTC 22103 / MED217) TaxID=398720 RepID=A3XR71_LEEBM|nr:dTDP-4-dehydrorhamnose reductase [Leeuwenhoekiella blandensis]EAQ47950.1 putative dTDP-4-dehydrorhamnose reductase [Leeuwenhoekiella blandensis MED217]